MFGKEAKIPIHRYPIGARVRLNQGKWKDGRSLAGLAGEVIAVDHKRHRVQIALKVGITVWCPPHCLEKLSAGAKEKSVLLTKLTTATLALTACFVIVGYSVVGAKDRDALPNKTPVLSQGVGDSATAPLSGDTDQAAATQAVPVERVIVKETALIARDDGCAVAGQVVNKENKPIGRVVVSAVVFDKNRMELTRNTIEISMLAGGESRPISILMPVDLAQVGEYKAEVFAAE